MIQLFNYVYKCMCSLGLDCSFEVLDFLISPQLRLSSVNLRIADPGEICVSQLHMRIVVPTAKVPAVMEACVAEIENAMKLALRMATQVTV